MRDLGRGGQAVGAVQDLLDAMRAALDQGGFGHYVQSLVLFDEFRPEGGFRPPSGLTRKALRSV